jgi:hypothetical protein
MYDDEVVLYPKMNEKKEAVECPPFWTPLGERFLYILSKDKAQLPLHLFT